MFCNNCGSKLPDGSRFCSVCGTRLVDLEPTVTEAKSAGNFGYAEDVRTDADRSESYENVATRVSFDWSNVIEEPIKKVVPEIRSPWVEPVVEERPAVEKPSMDHRRTMSFIEILKQEREEKLRAAELEAQAATARQEVVPDYSEFDNAPQMYDDIAKTVEAPLFEEPLVEEPAEAPVIEEPVVESPVIEETVAEEPEYIGKPFGFETADFTDFEPPLHTIAEEAAPTEPLFETSNLFKDLEEPVTTAPIVEEEAPIDFGAGLSVEDFYSQTLDFGAAEPGNLEAELDAILNAGAGRVSRAERNAAADIADEIEETEETEEATEDFVPEKADVTIENYVPEKADVTIEDYAPEKVDVADEIPDFPDMPKMPEVPMVDELKYDDSIFAPADSIEIEPFAETEEVEEVEDEVPVYTFDESIFAPAGTTEEPAEVPEFETPLPEEVPSVEEVSVAEVPEFEAPIYDEVPSLEDILAVDAAQPYDTAKATIVPAAEEESEIEELKKRLSMLMNDEPETAKAEPAATEVEVTEISTEDEVVVPEAEIDEAEEEEEISDAISLDELEKELFGDELPEETEAEVTKKIDKFYTLYKKNEEFQKLLEEEYDKLKEADENQTPDAVAEAVEAVNEEAETVAATAVATPISVPVQAAAEDKADGKADKAAAKKAEKAAKKEAKKAKKDDEESGGSGVLTVLAVIIAVILVVLLGVILVLNFAPDSGIAMTIDSVIENIASYFSDAGMIDNISLL